MDIKFELNQNEASCLLALLNKQLDEDMQLSEEKPDCTLLKIRIMTEITAFWKMMIPYGEANGIDIEDDLNDDELVHLRNAIRSPGDV
jgi:hypothetical protein